MTNITLPGYNRASLSIATSGRPIMKKIWLCTTLLALWAAPVLTQTMQELIDGKNTENVLTHSMGYDRKSYSPLKQINKSNIKRLVPIWNASMMNDQGELAQPTVYNGVMYAINGKWTFAIDVETGRQIWRTPTEIESGITRAAFNRGGATMPGNMAEVRLGGPARTIPSSILSIGAPAMRNLTIRDRVRVSIAYSRIACSRFGRKRVKSFAITSTHPTMCTTWMPPTSSYSRISVLRASFERS